MPIFKRIIILGALMFSSASVPAQDYECRKKDGQVIHILTLKAQDYDMQLVKAHDRVFGRETVESMAKRIGADIAINAGYFEIGNQSDGMPTSTLIINGKIFGLNVHKHSCLLKQGGKLSIKRVHQPLSIGVGKQSLNVHKVNKYPGAKDCVLFTSCWGSNTLTPLKGRKEITLDQDGKLISASDQGSSQIPHNGYVLSLPKNHPIDVAKIPKTFVWDIHKAIPLSASDSSAVMGMPILIEHGKLNKDVTHNKSSFYTNPHARTAIGIKPSGDVVVVVAEHDYIKALTEVTLGEVKDVMENNKLKLAMKYGKHPGKLNLNQLKDIVKDEFSSKNAATGLTLPDLASLMLKLGCESAINLDGGGSSSLYMNGKTINKTIGDADEAIGQLVARPVSDAIVFKKK